MLKKMMPLFFGAICEVKCVVTSTWQLMNSTILYCSKTSRWRRNLETDSAAWWRISRYEISAILYNKKQVQCVCNALWLVKNFFPFCRYRTYTTYIVFFSFLSCVLDILSLDGEFYLIFKSKSQREADLKFNSCLDPLDPYTKVSRV